MNQSGIATDPFRAHLMSIIVLMSMTMILALVGNVLLSFVIFRRSDRSNSRSLNPVQILILHTCLADVLFAVITIFPKLCTIISGPYFYGGDVVCRTVMYLQIVPMMASPFLLVAMSADRYQCICNPWTSLRRNKRLLAHMLAGMAWALSLLAPTPQLFIFRLVPEKNSSLAMCYAHFSQPWHGKLYTVCFSLIAWLIPSLASAYFYINVCTQVRKSAASVKNSRERHHQHYTTSSQKYVKRLRRSGTQHRLAANLEHQRRRTVKLTLTIVVFNFLLWAPFCITNVIHQFNSQLLDPVISTYIMLFGNLNSCVNPWIYLFFNRRQVFSFLSCTSNQEDSHSSRNQNNFSSRRSANNGTRTIPRQLNYQLSLTEKTPLSRNRHYADSPIFTYPYINRLTDQLL